MAISGEQIINIGLPNESANSDSLYTAFNKISNNFSTLFSDSSPFVTVTGNTGITVDANSTAGTVDITNTGVTEIIAGTGISIDQSNGAVTITNTGGNGNGAGVTSVGVTSSTLTVSNSPIVSSGNITLNLSTISNSLAGTYVYPTVTVDNYGRISSISNANSVGTVTSVGVTPGAGISVTNSPITSSGNITVTNTGVTRVNAGTGIAVSSANGNVTISTTPVAAVTGISVTSNALTITGSPITSSGTITVDLPTNLSITGNITGGKNLYITGSEDLDNGAAANLQVMASYFSTGGAETATLAAGSNGQFKSFMMVADGGNMVITVTNAGWKSSGTGTITFTAVGESCLLQYVNNKWFVIGNNGCTFA